MMYNQHLKIPTSSCAVILLFKVLIKPMRVQNRQKRKANINLTHLELWTWSPKPKPSRASARIWLKSKATLLKLNFSTFHYINHKKISYFLNVRWRVLSFTKTCQLRVL
jgi:hypothetical protein